MGKVVEFKTTEIEEIKSYLRDGLTYAEVGELMGRTKKSISNLAQRMGWSNGRLGGNQLMRGHLPANRGYLGVDKKVAEEAIEETRVSPPKETSVKEKTLKDFSAREMIKHLYNLGYRIEDNKLVCYVKQAVNVKDIING